jgi:hypothetical protein
MPDKSIQASLVKFFDQIKVKNKGVPIELTLQIDGERYEVVNTETPVEVTNTNKEIR